MKKSEINAAVTSAAQCLRAYLPETDHEEIRKFGDYELEVTWLRRGRHLNPTYRLLAPPARGFEKQGQREVVNVSSKSEFVRAAERVMSQRLGLVLVGESYRYVNVDTGELVAR